MKFRVRNADECGRPALEHPLKLPKLDIGLLATLTLDMMRLGMLHVAERVNGAA